MAKFWKRKAVFFVKKKAPHNRFTGFLPSFPRSVVSPGCCCWMESSSRVCDRVIFLFFFFLPFLIFSRLGTPASRVVFPFCLLFPVCCSFSSNRRLNRRAIFQPKIQQKKTRDGRPFVFVVLSPALPQQDTRLRFRFFFFFVFFSCFLFLLTFFNTFFVARSLFGANYPVCVCVCVDEFIYWSFLYSFHTWASFFRRGRGRNKKESVKVNTRFHFFSGGSFFF